MTELLAKFATWGVLLSIAAYGLGLYIQRKTRRPWLHPLLLSSILIIVLLSGLRVPYPDFKASASPVAYLLLPATVSLAIPLYEQWELLKKNTTAILIGCFSGVLASLGSIAVMAWILRMERVHAATLLPKSVTTAIGMDVAKTLGGMAPLAAAAIILTGIAGNLIAEWLLKALKIEEPLARGIAIGTSSHAIGTAKALELGEVEGAMSGLAIAVAGVMTAVLAPVVAVLLP
ncbi:MAG: LrgB family protein [Oscillibacter sp.]|nr:LrgB family protein [Oscillibacter sp.]